LLTKLRPIAKKFVGLPARTLASANVHPNLLTIIGLILSLFVPLVTYYLGPVIASILILLSAYFDVLDGEVARISGKKSLFGAFLDSTTDRIEDALYSISFIFVGSPSLVVITLIISSYLISYTRARAEALGVKMEGIGVIERAERIILITVALAISSINIYISIMTLILLIGLSIVTIIQRVVYVYRILGRSP